VRSLVVTRGARRRLCTALLRRVVWLKPTDVSDASIIRTTQSPRRNTAHIHPYIYGLTIQ
jgi:hypothetical protein